MCNRADVIRRSDAPAPRADNPRMARILSPIALVLANLVPLIGVLAWGWDAAAIVICYWSENLIIGALTIAKMLGKGAISGVLMSSFFVVHYGGFCAVHGFFVLVIFGFEIGDTLGDLDWPIFFVFVELLVRVMAEVVDLAPGEWLWAFVALAASHSISLVTNYFWRGEHQNQTINDLMSAPYARVIVLHVAIIAGGWGALALGSPTALLIALVIGKTALDLAVHLKEHKLPVRVLWRRPALAQSP